MINKVFIPLNNRNAMGHKFNYYILGFLLISILFSLSFVVAETNTYSEVKSGDSKLLQQTCGTCTYVNISVAYPNSTMAVTNQPMNNLGGGVWEYQFNDTTSLGRYDVSTCGDIDGAYKCTDSGTLYFMSTRNGETLSQADSNVGTGAIYFFLGLGIIFIVFGLFILNKGFWASWAGIFSIIFGFIFLYYDLSMVNFYVNTLTLNSSSATGAFLMVSRFIKLMPYIIWLIVGFAVIAIFKAIKKSKSNDDGWDNNQY